MCLYGAVMDIGEFMSQKDEIERLTEQLRLSNNNVIKWKSKYHQLAKEHRLAKPLTRTGKAIKLIKLKTLSLKEIAIKCSITYSYVCQLSGGMKNI